MDKVYFLVIPFLQNKLCAWLQDEMNLIRNSWELVSNFLIRIRIKSPRMPNSARDADAPGSAGILAGFYVVHFSAAKFDCIYTRLDSTSNYI